ncbi:DMT family transporter [Actinobacillus equuli]|uniref:DMT family transporter n=1 Tax=Actinobacillus equuli TaxID=718 RepID=UPI002441B624|nr:DMT family transporter [Actinobacillus equuli]WGE53351.1 DMT family transporter [Actinobacillus equuli subsp. haemolyticus]WGE69725.1 DMT family transporter [Actinobacillus equuli subsp. haemolyticus]WGE73786.1 DMT family transporter [Actinobacillus equuli subsp. haemolyticus]WGE79754.1 DMT family transporter [Actinobacillus equuli subsp. equuli]
MSLPYILLALVAGSALASQAAINSRLAQAMLGQPLVAATISFATGTIALLLFCFWKTDLSGALQQLPSQPFWKLLGGILGAGFVFTTVFLAPKIGITNMLFFIIIGQLVTGAIIDHFGLFGMAVRPFQLNQLIGLLTVACGLGIYFLARK